MRPRHEEQFDAIKRIEARLLFEINHIEEIMYSNEEVEDFDSLQDNI